MESLKQLIHRPGVVIAPGVYDVVTATLVERSGFDCAYMTGSGVSISVTGYPDIGLISYSEVSERVGNIAQSIRIPLVADADTGFGGPLNVVRAVRDFEHKGASAIQLEDQASPKKCGHELGRSCVSIDEMVGKIRAACDARESDDFLVVARTDARTSEGLSSALARAEAYGNAGADVLFIESLESVDEMKTARARLSEFPLMANMVEGGRSPLLGRSELDDIGYDIAIFPNTILRTVCAQVNQMLLHLKDAGKTSDVLDKMWLHREVWDLFDHDKWVALENRYRHH